jgi:Xaa-Pro aminopeptidase
MEIKDFDGFRRRFFAEKRAHLEQTLETPLLLYWGKWDGPNIRALTLAAEFTRPTFFLCRPGGVTVAFVQQIEVNELAPLESFLDIVPYRTAADLKNYLAAALKEIKTVAAEVSDDFFGLDRLPPSFLKFIASCAEVQSADDILLPFRAKKTQLELALMRRAVKKTLEIFNRAEKFVRAGAAEQEILKFLMVETVAVGCDVAFPPIIASGARSGFPHPQRRSRKAIATGDRVIIDFGLDFFGYKADVTRTYIAGGHPSDDEYYNLSIELIRILREAELGEMTPETLGRALAGAVQEAGLRDRERHGYGHGLGVETHDPHPYIAAASLPWLDRPFEDGMVFTFEPGFYDDEGGFRLEDDYVVWEGRAVPLQDFEPAGELE